MNQELCEVWQENWEAIQAYSFATCEGILAAKGHYPGAIVIEDIAANAIAVCWGDCVRKPEKILAWRIPKRRLKTVFSYLRRCCKQEVREWLKSRLPELSGNEKSTDISEGRIADILLSLPPELRGTAEGFALGKSQTQIADELKLDPRTIHRHKIRLKRKLGTVLFCRWIESAMSGPIP